MKGEEGRMNTEVDFSKTIKYMDYKILELLNKSSVKNKRNRNFWMDKLPIDKEGLYPVVLGFPHEGQEMRTKLMLNADGDVGWLDISFDEYEKLPVMETPQYMLDVYEAVVKANQGE